MRTENMKRLIQFIKSNVLREYLLDSDFDLIDLDSEIINLLFQLEVSSDRLEYKIRELQKSTK